MSSQQGGAEKTSAGQKPESANGKLGIMVPGMGAVATTFIAGVEAVRKGLAKPIGSVLVPSPRWEQFAWASARTTTRR
jgi:myo-inositol-1-phosphate synthase